MGYGDTWERAQQAAAQAVGALAPADRATLVLFCRRRRSACCDRRPTRRACVAEIDAAQPSAGATRYGPALKLAGSLLAESNLPRREVVLVTDFQRSGWPPGDGVAAAGRHDVHAGRRGDRAPAPTWRSTPVAVQRSRASGSQERVTVTAGVLQPRRRGGHRRAAALEIDGRVVQTRAVDVAAGRVGVRDVRAGDDHRREHARVRPCSAGAPARRAGARQRVPLRALAAGAGARRGAWSARRRARRRPSISRARWRSAIARASTPRRSRRTRSATTRWRGRASSSSTTSPLERRGRRAADDVRRGRRRPARRARSAGGAGRRPGDLAAGDAGRARSIARAARPASWAASSTATPSSSRSARRAAATSRPRGSTAIARSPPAKDAAGAGPLRRRRAGAGRSAPSAAAGCWCGRRRSTSFWNDLALKPVFLPFVHQMVRHLAGYREQRRGWADGRPGHRTLSHRRGERPPRASCWRPSGSARLRRRRASTADVLEVAEQGFYEVREAGRRAGPRHRGGSQRRAGGV